MCIGYWPIDYAASTNVRSQSDVSSVCLSIGPAERFVAGPQIISLYVYVGLPNI
jgi:hypothetical protein